MNSKKQVCNVDDLQKQAIKMVQDVGFILHNASKTTESRYYRLPDRVQLLRISTHKYVPTYHSEKDFVICSISITPQNRHTRQLIVSNQWLYNTVAIAIGKYMLKSDTPKAL